MSVFVMVRSHDTELTPDWWFREYKTRQEALKAVNETSRKPDSFFVIEGVRLKLEPVTQVTQYQFARGT